MSASDNHRGGQAQLVDAGPDCGRFLADPADEGVYAFGPYNVEWTRKRFKQPFIARRIRPEGQTTWRVRSKGHTGSCVLQANAPFPGHVRAGIEGFVDQEPLNVGKRWFRPVQIRGGAIDWELRRRGLFGWILVRRDGETLALSSRGRPLVRSDLSAAEAAVCVALTATTVKDAVSPVAFLRGL